MRKSLVPKARRNLENAIDALNCADNLAQEANALNEKLIASREQIITLYAQAKNLTYDAARAELKNFTPQQIDTLRAHYAQRGK